MLLVTFSVMCSSDKYWTSKQKYEYCKITRTANAVSLALLFNLITWVHDISCKIYFYGTKYKKHNWLTSIPSFIIIV